MRADKVLEQFDIDFGRIEQDEPVKTCEEAAEARNLKESQIVKSLIVEKDSKYYHICIPGNRTLSEKKFGPHRLVDPEKSEELTGLESGTVHPFSTDLKHFFDERIFEQDELSFTVGNELEAVKIKPRELRKAIEGAGFEFEVTDLAVVDKTDIAELKSSGLEDNEAKFVADKGLRKIFFQLERGYSAGEAVDVLLKLEREMDDFNLEQAEKIIERAENETHMQKLVEKLSQNGELPEEDDFDQEKVIQDIIDENPEAVEDYRSGRDSALNFFIGKVMQETNGRADAGKVREKLEEELDE